MDGYRFMPCVYFFRRRPMPTLAALPGDRPATLLPFSPFAQIAHPQ